MIVIDIDIPKTCNDCPFCIFTADEKRAIGYCNTSNEDYYCKALERFMEYDLVDGGYDILGKPTDCPIKCDIEDIKEDLYDVYGVTGWVEDRFENVISIIDKHTKGDKDADSN